MSLQTVRRGIRDTATPRFERASVAYAEGREFGVDEPRFVGPNLLPANVANGGEDGTTSGFKVGAYGGIESSADYAFEGARSIKASLAGSIWSSGVQVSVTTTPGKTYTASVWVKADVGTSVGLYFRDNGRGYGVTDTSVLPDGGWHRLRAAFANVTGSMSINVYSSQGTRSDPITIYVDGLQLEEGDTATPWIAPNGMLMLEEGTTNHVTRIDPTVRGHVNGQGFDIVSGVADFLQGGLYVRKPLDGSNWAYPGNLGVVAGKTYTYSFFCKMDDETEPNIGSNGDFAIVLGNATSTQDLRKMNLGNGLWRVSVSRAIGTTTSNNGILATPSHSGKGFRASGFQLEEKPYPTSLTEGTRAPESLRIPTAGVLLPEQGQIDVDLEVGSNPNSWYLDLGGTGVDGFVLYAPAGGSLRFSYGTGSALRAVISERTLKIGDKLRSTLRWSGNGGVLAIDGVTVASRPDPSVISFRPYGDLGRRNENYANARFYGFRILSTPMSDADIAAEAGKPLTKTPTTTYLLPLNGNLRVEQGTTYLPRFRGRQTVTF